MALVNAFGGLALDATVQPETPVITMSISTTTVGSTVSADVTGYQAATIQYTTPAGNTTGAIVIEGSLDGNVWGILTTRYRSTVNSSNAYSATSAFNVNAANTTYLIEVTMGGIKFIRIRVATALTGLPTIKMIAHQYPTFVEQAGLAGFTQPISGSVTVSGYQSIQPAPVGTLYTATTTATAFVAQAKSSAGNMTCIAISNTSANTIYVKLYNATSIVLGTTVPIMVIPVSGNSFYTAEFGTIGLRYSTGIYLAVTGGMATDNTTPVSAGSIIAINYIN